MIKNVKLKAFLVDRIFPLFSLINKFVPKDDQTIFIYCANDLLNDNSEALFNYLLENGYAAKYKIICGGVADSSAYDDVKSDRVKFIPKRKCVTQYMRSGHVFYSMGKIPIKPAGRQCVINMWHGIPLKTIGKLSNIHNGNEFFFNYVCASSELYRPIMAKAFGCPEENVCICGEPKTDKLFRSKEPSGFQANIVWTPTFRQSEFLGYNDSKDTSLLPLFQDDEWDALNDFLKEKNVKMTVKLHPLQDLHGFYHEEKSHLEIFSDACFQQNGMNLYDVLSQSDGLVADYSSVYLEYLVLDRPICFTVGDMDEYSATRGFVFENPKEYMPGDFVSDREGLYRFIDELARGLDHHREWRRKVNSEVNFYRDGENCRRTLAISGVSPAQDSL